MHSALYTGQVRHRRFAPRGARLRIPAVHGLARPGRAGHGVPRPLAVVDHAARRSPGCGAPITSATRSCRSTRRCATWSSARPAPGRAGRFACSRTCATSATASTRSASTTASTRPTARVETIVAEITNTPWDERHAYVLTDRAERRPGARPSATASTKRSTSRRSCAWTSHYDWRFNAPGETLAVHMADHKDGAKLFDATLAARTPRDQRRHAGACRCSPFRS